LPEGTAGGAAGSGRRTEETDKKRGPGRARERENGRRFSPGWERERREERSEGEAHSPSAGRLRGEEAGGREEGRREEPDAEEILREKRFS